MAHNNKNLGHHHTIKEEIFCHFPYAIFSVAFSIIMLSILSHMISDNQAFVQLFHDFHYLHILFASTGVVLTFRKYSKSILGALFTGVLVPAIFCTLSDSLLPYFGGVYLGLPVHFHWCFIAHLSSVLPFLAFGIINGFVLSNHATSQQLFFSTSSHFLHIFTSSMASILFLVAAGANDWHIYLGFIFMFLIIAVFVPCTLSDIVVPIIFAQKHDSYRGQQSFGCCTRDLKNNEKSKLFVNDCRIKKNESNINQLG